MSSETSDRTNDDGPHGPHGPAGGAATESFVVHAIGRVVSPLTDLSAAPRQPDEGAPGAWLAFDARLADALVGVRVGDALLVLTWLDRARRDVLQVHPRGDLSRPLTGVFATRAPDRPNPIGVHRVEVVAIDTPTEGGPRVAVRALEALDGTPILDVKPLLGSTIAER